MKEPGEPSSTNVPLVPEDGWPSQYGVVIAEHNGTGSFILRSAEDLPCRFQSVQLASGYVFLFCASDGWSLLDADSGVERFEGATTQGDAIYAEHLTRITCPPIIPPYRQGSWFAFLARELRVEADRRVKQPATARFGIANFEFVGTEPRRLDGRQTLGLPIRLSGRNHVDDAVIVPLGDYEAKIWRAKALRGIEVTSELLVPVQNSNDLDRLTSLATDLCYLLSVARGTKIQWLYRDTLDADAVPIVRTHFRNVVKPFTPLPVIDHRAGGRHETKAFVEQTYPVYVEKREGWKLNSGLLGTYLDAKAEHDYLQPRGVKLAVAVEMLKDIFLATSGCRVAKGILDSRVFQDLKPQIKEDLKRVLQKADIDKADRSAMYSKLPELNRRPFREVLGELCAELDVDVTSEDLRLFAACRNSIVHKGYFYAETATEEERKKCRPLPSADDEYFFLVSLLDKFIIRLMDYHGPYIDWRIPGQPVRKNL